MAEMQDENLNSLFAPTGKGLESDILGVLQSILRLYSITPQELFWKWESYCLKMGPDDTLLDLATARMFQKDVQENLERSNQGKQSERKPTVGATPRAIGKSGDVYGMLDELTPNAAPRRTASVKRKNNFETPAPKRVAKAENKTSNAQASGIPFAERQNSGSVLETINGHIPEGEAAIAPHAEARVKLIANTDVKKFGYKPMSMHINESSEVLDERIDDFASLIQKHHQLEESAFGNAAAQSTNEIVAVGRIACDTPEGKLNQASLLLELSRRWGGGLRIPLKVDSLDTFSFFPGQIVALRGNNASGQYFQVNQILTVPQLPMPVSTPATIEVMNEKLGASDESAGMPLKVLFASGPYTADDNLDFEPLQALCQKASEDMVDAMVLTGPFLDIEHPLLASGDFDLPDVKVEQDPSMTSLFRLWISTQLEKVCSAIPSMTIVLVPSIRDVISKHVSWPQESLARKELGLPKQVKMLPDPCFISLNEVVVGISSHDIMLQLSREQISHNNKTPLLDRLPTYLIDQRHFFPLYPSLSRDNLSQEGNKVVGDCIDLGYYKLGEWPSVRPDVLFLPSTLTPSVKVINDVVVINPGPLTKRKAAGTYSQFLLQSRKMSDDEKNQATIPHDVFQRARVDIVRI